MNPKTDVRYKVVNGHKEPEVYSQTLSIKKIPEHIIKQQGIKVGSITPFSRILITE